MAALYRFKIGFFTLLAGVAMLFNGCGPDKKQGPTKTVFKYNESAGITSLDPAFARDQANIWAVNQLFNGLVQMDDELRIQPCIAKSWNISEDGMIYEFIIRNDVYFHDHPTFENGKGRKVIAADFVNSFFRIIDEATASPGAWIFSNIDRSARSNYLGFEAVSDTILKVYLNKPFPPFLGLLTTPYCAVTPYEVVDRYGKDFRNNPVGTGPFIFKMWKEGVKLVMVKNGNYFEKDEQNKTLPYLDALSITFISDKQTEFIEFLKGNLDILSGLDGRGSYKDELIGADGKLNAKHADKFLLEMHPYLNTEYLGILMEDVNKKFKDNPLKLKQVRQALNYGFDRNKIITYLRNNVGMAATSGIVPKGMPSFDAEKVIGYNYNPVKAKQLLSDAGFPEGRGLPEIVLSCTDKRLDVFESVQSQLAEIGVKIKLDVNPAAVHRQMVAKSVLQMFWASWIADYPDAESYFSIFYSKNKTPIGPNSTHFNSALFDQLYERALLQTSDSTRFILYQQMDQLIVDEAPVIPLYYDQVMRVYPKNIQGLKGNAMNMLTLKKVRK